MKYQRMTEKWVDDNRNNRVRCNISSVEQCEIVCDICDECWVGKINRRLCELEDKIESGELCDRKETAREILLLLGKGFDETTRKNFKDLPWYKQFCRELKFRYGVELLGNSDKLEKEE